MPKPLTSGSKAEGRFGKMDFIYIAKADEYRCPAGECLKRGSDVIEDGMRLQVSAKYGCGECPIMAQCTSGTSRKIERWEHEDVLDKMQQRLDRNPHAMKIRRRTVEHVFGTLKHWMGSAQFLMKTLDHVPTEMSLHVLAYNLKGVTTLLGITKTQKAMKLAGA